MNARVVLASLLGFLGTIALAPVFSFAQQQGSHRESKFREGSIRERERFFYARLTSGAIKNPEEIRRLGVAGFRSMQNPKSVQTESAAAWSPLGTSVDPYASGRVRSIAFDPANPNGIYIAATVGGIWKTNDITRDSVIWQSIGDALPTSVCNSIAILSQQPNTIWVGTGEPYPGDVAPDGRGVFKSMDGGLNWTNVLSSSVMGPTCAQIAVDPLNPAIAFVAAPGWIRDIEFGMDTLRSYGLFRTEDGGQNWQRAALPTTFYPVCVVIDSSNDQRVYATGFGGELYRSTNGGNTWILSNYATMQFPSNPLLAIAPNLPSTLYLSAADDVSQSSAGLFKSTNYGVTWTLVNDARNGAVGATDPDYLQGQGDYSTAIAIDQYNPNHVVVGGISVYESTNGGKILRQISNESATQGSPTYSHADDHFMLFRNGKLYCANDGGISIFDGSNWITKQNSGLPTLEFVGIDADKNFTYVLGGTQDNGTTRSPTVQSGWSLTHDGDGGNTWVSPLNNQIAYCTWTGTTIFRSTDGARTWSDNPGTFTSLITNKYLLQNEGAPFYPSYDASSDGSVVAFGGNDHVYFTTNGGDDGFSGSGNQSMGVVNFVRVSQRDPQFMWAGTNDSIWRSNDEGLNWIVSSLPVTGSVVGIVTGDSDAVLYAVIAGLSADSNGHFVKSTDGGATWKTQAKNFPMAPANCLSRAAADSPTPGELFVGTDYGVIASSDDGRTWSRFGVGMPTVQVLSLKVTGAQDQYLLAGTQGRGVYTIQLSPLAVSNTSPAAFRLSECYPNPISNSASASTEINFDLGSLSATPTEATLTLTDALGREIAVLAHDRYIPGPHTVKIPTSTLTSGEYLVRLTFEARMVSRKFTVLR